MERLLMVVRNHEEAEPAVVVTDDPKTLELVLEDGSSIQIDRVELAAALAEAA